MNENEIDHMLKEITIIHNNIKKQILVKKIYTIIGTMYFLNMFILLKYFYQNIKNKNFTGTDILFVLYISNLIDISKKYFIY